MRLFKKAFSFSKKGSDSALTDISFLDKEIKSVLNMFSVHQKVSERMKKILLKMFFMLKFVCFLMLACCNPSQAGLDLKSVLVLGIGGDHGAHYKKQVFQEIRDSVETIHVCDAPTNPIAPFLLEEKLVDHFYPIEPHNIEKAFQEIMACIKKKDIHPKAVFTVREEWLQISAAVSETLGLPHQSIWAYQNSQDKSLAREVLEKKGIESFHYQTALLRDLEKTAFVFGYPCFVKPQSGIRSELARFIKNEDSLKAYVEDVHRLGTPLEKKILLEEVLVGHEVDADIVLYEGQLVYGNISDNFPTFLPFTLETGQLSPSVLSSKTQKRLLDHSYRVVQALGYDRGVLHVELMLKQNGDIALIEVNGRPGGMYIANWHKHIWGVELIKAQLAIASGKDPRPFLVQKIPTEALAQVCITSNTENNAHKGLICIDGWLNCAQLAAHPETYQAAIWDPLPLQVDTTLNGHPNIGELTVRGEQPGDAFRNLVELCRMYPPILGTTVGDLATSLAALRRFCCTTPEIERFSIRKASNNDLEKIQGLLVHLTPRAFGDFPTMIPEQTIVLVASDAFTQARDLVGTIALQTRKGLRPLKDQGSAHLHDFVVHPHYRHSGIGRALLTCALSEAHSHGISKNTLDCDKSCTSFYESFGFQPAAVHMVMYADAPQCFDKNLIQNQGEWMYGTLIAESLKAVVENIKIPKHFFLPLGSDPGKVSDELSLHGNGFAVKYSLLQGDFSGNGRRGANSSRGRTLVPASNSTAETVTKLEAFLKQAPENCVGLVLQELIDQTSGCLFHVELGDQTVVEMLWESYVSTGRALSEYRTKDQKLVFHEEIVGNGIGEPMDRLKGGGEIAKRCQHIFTKHLKNYGNICWSIEGFWKPVDQTLTILQLRPTPLDRPESTFKHFKNILYQTGFSWGCFDVGPLNLRQPDTSVFIRNDAKATELEVTLLDRLRAGEKTLLIDTERGFTLSHERWFLPPPSLRENFGFIYIPQNTLNQLSQKLVRIISSRYKGYVVDFN